MEPTEPAAHIATVNGALRPGVAARETATGQHPAILPLPRVGAPDVHCVVLAGGLAPSPLKAASGMNVLDLLLRDDDTVFDVLLEAIETAGVPAGRTHLLCSRHVPLPRRCAELAPAEPVVWDQAKYRGPAGVVRDAASVFGDAQLLLIVEGSRAMLPSFEGLISRHLDRGSKVTLMVNPDGSPAGVFLANRETLDLIPASGFSDLKEQWLGKVVASKMRIDGEHVPAPGLLPIRDLGQAIEAARAATRGAPAIRPRRTRRCGIIDQHPDDAFSVVHPSAVVHPTAAIIDSIIMPEAVIDEGAVVVRSLVVGGARVPAGAEVVDAILRGPSSSRAAPFSGGSL